MSHPCILYILLIACTLTSSRADSCEKLRLQWPNRYDDFRVGIEGHKYPVRVYGEGGSARAAAALMLVLLRHVVGYEAKFIEATYDICDFEQRTNGNINWNRSTIVVPAAPSAGCNTSKFISEITDYTMSNIPYPLHLLAHLTDPKCRKLTFDSKFYLNSTILESCNFLKNLNCTESGDCAAYFLILARDYNKKDFRAIRELQRRIEILKLPLKIENNPNDTLFREKVLKLQNQNQSFLFLDEDMWGDITNIFHVQNALVSEPIIHYIDMTNNIRIGNGIFMQRNAPLISNLVSQFEPRQEHLRQILEYEALSINSSNIEDAACLWALNNEIIVKNWTLEPETTRAVYKIAIFFCYEDPDIDIHLNIVAKIWDFLDREIKDLEYNFVRCNMRCDGNENYLSNNITSMAYSDRLAGAIVWTSGMTVSAVTEAENRNVILMLAGHNPTDVPSDTATAIHSTMALLTNLTYAYVELLNRCSWSRIAILSDKSIFSKNFIDTFLSKKKIIFHQIFVDLNNIDVVLDDFKSKDARIYFVNTNWDIARKILCTASKKGMTPAANVMWIVREWRAVNCTEGSASSSMYHLTIGTSWRGGPTTEGSLEVQSMLQEIWNTNGNVLTGSVGGASLADAILLLGYGFASFLREYPSDRFNLHDVGNSMKFSKILNKLTINGTAQQLKSKAGKTIVFVEKWRWTKGETVALWYVTPSRIIEIWPDSTAAITCDKLIGRQIPDRENCLLRTGDDFAPRCQVVTVITVAFLLILAIIALYIARRVRLSNLKSRNEEDRKRIFASLDGYLIKRNCIRLLHIIGSGSTGIVRFAELKKIGAILPIAAKEPHDGIPIYGVNEFLREACLLASLSHENIIRLVGICIGDGPPIILTEHAFYNDLKRYLVLRRQFAISARHGVVSAEKASEVSDSELTRFAKEAAKALEYLAENRLIHRDVRAANCLVDKNRSLKLADFGLARELDCKSSSYMATYRRLFPVSWMPPESLKKGIFSTASDVWALGVLILEVATFGARPYGDWPLKKVCLFVKSGGHPSLPPDTSKYTRNLVLACWQSEEKDRPSAGYIHRFLKTNPYAISPALLIPDTPKWPSNNMKKNDNLDEIASGSRTSWILSNSIC